MNLSEDFFYKNRLAVMKLARDFLIMDMEQQIPTIAEYIQKFNFSRGTVQAAIALLAQQDCIKTKFKGYLGSFLTYKNTDKLWALAGFGTLNGAMPLPLDGLLSGLATGICDCMRAKKIDFNCVFIQGSRTRLHGLARKKYDFIIASRLTAQMMLDQYPNLELVMNLDSCMYSGKYILMFSNSEHTEITDGMTVAVDPASVDQANLTELLCRGKHVNLLELAYINTAKSVAEGKADAVVSSLETVLKIYPQMPYHDMILPEYTEQQIQAFTDTVVLAEKDNYGLKPLLQYVLVPAMIANKQQLVMEGKALENYY